MSRVLLALVSAVVLTNACQAQSIGQTKAPITVNFGVVMPIPTALGTLEREWSVDPKQHERAYCVAAVSYGVQTIRDTLGNLIGKEVVARVWSVIPAKVEGTSPSHISKADCPPGMPFLHTHPPTTCTDDDDVSTCVYGGVAAFQCQPSRADYEILLASGNRFGIIQCGPQQFRFYWPQEYRP